MSKNKTPNEIGLEMAIKVMRKDYLKLKREYWYEVYNHAAHMMDFIDLKLKVGGNKN